MNNINGFSRDARRAGRKAFTIIEVLFASVVMMAGVVGMIQVITAGSEMIDLSRKQTLATQIIHSEIEKLHLVAWSDLPASGNFTPDASFSTSMQMFQSPVYTRTVTTVRTDLKQFTYTVAWRAGRTASAYARAYSRSGSTYVAKNGLYITYQKS